MLPRIFLLLLAAATWSVSVWMASHVSTDPTLLGRYSLGYAAFLLVGFAAALGLTTAGLARHDRARKLALRAGLLLFGVVASIALAEVVVRVADPIGISYYDWSMTYHREKVADAELGYRHRPDYRARYGGIEYAYNELGLRDRPIPDKVDGEYRVLGLGDSILLGMGVPAEAAFLRLVEPRLSGRSGRPVRTINTGVGSYDTSQQLAFLRRHVAALRPDLVLLVYCVNDIEPKLSAFDPDQWRRLSGRSPPEIIRVLLSYSWLYLIANHISSYRSFEQSPPDPAGSGMRASMDSLRGIARECRDRGLPFVCFFWRYGSTPANDVIWGEIEIVAKESGFPAIDVGPWFAGKDVRPLTNSIVDSHPNAAGHRLAAERMDHELSVLGLPPPR